MDKSVNSGDKGQKIWLIFVDYDFVYSSLEIYGLTEQYYQINHFKSQDIHVIK